MRLSKTLAGRTLTIAASFLMVLGLILLTHYQSRKRSHQHHSTSVVQHSHDESSNLIQNVPSATSQFSQDMKTAYGKLPIHFEANAGQTDRRVKFLARGNGYSLFLTSTEAVLALRESSPRRGTRATRSVVRMELLGASRSPIISGLDELPGKSNYFIGNNPAKWRTNVSTYAKVGYENVYPGVDAVFHGNQGILEYDFVVAPHANYKQIRLKYQGPKKLRIDEATGDLILTPSEGGELRQQKPVIYQEIAGERRTVEGSYQLQGKSHIAFRIGEYDTREALVIDPTLVYSTFLGGENFESGWDVAVDALGRAYVCGETGSTNFPAQNAAQATGGGANDGFVAQFSVDGTQLLYSTYVGGNSDDAATSIAVDSQANAYITGATRSTNFPTKNALQSSFGGGFADVFVMKLNPTGQISYSTFVGGGGGASNEAGNSIAVDGQGNAYVGGYTQSYNFPVINALQPVHGGALDKGIVFKLNSSGSQFIYSTYFGGNASDFVNAIAVDDFGNAYLVGQTDSTNLSTQGVVQTVWAGNFDAFVAKISGSGTNLIYATYLGGTNLDQASGIAVDASGNAYVCGSTLSTDFPTQNPVQPNNASFRDAFVAKLNPQATQRMYSTYLGGNRYDDAFAIAVDHAGNAYVTGQTTSETFPVLNALQPAIAGGFSDAFVTKLSTAGGLVYSTYLGGSGGQAELGHGISVDARGDAYVCGTAASSDFPLKNPFQGTIRGVQDAFIAKITDGSSQCNNVNFGLASSFAAGTSPVSIAAGDFNADGRVDLAVANQLSNNVSILLGTGTGSFGNPANFAAGSAPQSISIGDFNSDGKLDLAVANATNVDNVSVLLGTGSGVFNAPTKFTAGPVPTSIGTADFNNDGRFDLAVSDQNSNSIWILLGTGTGSFGAATSFAAGMRPFSVTLGDFNNDGKRDVATANYGSANVSILLGTGTGSFGAPTNFATAQGPHSIVVGDFNGDGKLDLASANQLSNNMSILLGTGTGSFNAATNFAVGLGPTSVAVGDLNSDGKADVAVTNNGSHNVSVLLGTGTGSLNPAVNFGVGSDPIFVVASDLSGDGKFDLATANYSNINSNVSILLNNCQVATPTPTPTPSPSPTPTPTPQVVPVIFIPGIGGSVLESSGSIQWPIPALPPCRFDDLTLDPSELQTNIVASNVIRPLVYSRLLNELGNQGYSESGPNQNLFVFPYDWRRSNEQSQHVPNLRQLINQIRTRYPGTNVNIVAHSMGGLLARRYILKYGDHHVEKLVTLGSPWLGAPKATNVLETGHFVEIPSTSLYVCSGIIKKLSEFFPGVHELLPSKAYSNLGGRPFRESGWDIDQDGNAWEEYTYNNLVTMLDHRFRSSPGLTGFNFHEVAGQDDWTSDVTGVSYYHIFGWNWNADTIGQVVAKRGVRCKNLLGQLVCTWGNYVDVAPTQGDGTVPLLSLRRIAGNADLNAPGRKLIPVVALNSGDDKVSHFNMVKDDRVIAEVLNALNAQSTSQSSLTGSSAIATADQLTPAAAYYARTFGALYVSLTDAFGNSEILLGEGNGQDLPKVTRYILGDKMVLGVVAADDTHVLNVTAGSDPVTIEVTKGTDTETTSAVRYVDLVLSAGSKAVLRLTPDGAELLKYDSDGDGTFETTIPPTTSVTGTTAQDTEGPVLTVAENMQSQNVTLVTVNATDSASDVKKINYSLDGTNYQTYSAPFLVDPYRVRKIYAFADDNVANRSGLVEFQLTAPPPIVFVEQGTTNQAVALDSVTWLRSPFPILTNFNFSPDRHTRVILFISGPLLIQSDVSIVTVQASGFTLPVENVGTVIGVTGLNASYIVVSLPDGLPAGELPLTIAVGGVVNTNSVTLGISP